MGIREAPTMTIATVWTCDFCSRTAVHTAGTGSPLTSSYFIDSLRWLALDDTTIACDRCRKHTDIAYRAFTQTAVRQL